MRYFKIDLNTVLKINMLYFENLIPPRHHCTRYAPEYILYAVTDGVLHLEDNGKNVTLRAGDIYIFKKGEFHKPVEDTACSIYVHFDSPEIEETEMDDEAFRAAVEEKRINLLKADRFSVDCYRLMHVYMAQKFHISDVATFNYIVGELKKIFISPNYRKAGDCLGVSFSFANILMELENIQLSHLAKRTEKNMSRTYYTVKNIANFIDENYAAEFSREEIEKRFYLNFDNANRIFKKYIGQSIAKYRNSVRIRVAKSMMISSSKNFGEIAEEIGFRDQYYFSRVFKQLEGVSPSEYMRRFMFESGEMRS